MINSSWRFWEAVAIIVNGLIVVVSSGCSCRKQIEVCLVVVVVGNGCKNGSCLQLWAMVEIVNNSRYEQQL